MAADERPNPAVPYRMPRRDEGELLDRAAGFYREMDGRRSVREFSERSVPREAIELAIRTASTAPSGAHRQPWRFVAIDDPAIKTRIRHAAEVEERRNYGERMTDEFRGAVAPLGTGPEKPFLEIAPWLVVVFEQPFLIDSDGTRRPNYYVRESAAIACGLFVAALHHMGLATLPHTPSPMGFLGDICGRPENERAILLFPVGYAADDATVPDLRRKSLDEVAVWNPAANRNE
ncbi:MAG: nitroreductase family protein [Chloroflexota bacterium]|jgi:nitroreductase|nr:nitroreductase family protein [Chloroflexota bacterium]MDP6509553.1 nitroreductase family protein [Chloroflexota bacterium]MDP6758521.1 nitroreductase family protein [Chloroflexota bacterium]